MPKNGLTEFAASIGRYVSASAALRAHEAGAALQAMATKAATTFTPESSFLRGDPMNYGAGASSSTNDAYNNSWVAFSCIKRLATDASGVRLLVLRDPNDSDSIVPPSHPVARMFMNPNPLFNSGQFVQSIITMLNLRGEFFIVFDDELRPTQMIQYTEPRGWRPVVNQSTGELVAWEYRNGQSYIPPIIPQSIIQHRFIDPSDPLRGQPPLRAAAKAYSIDLGADTLQQDVIMRGGERAVLYKAGLDVTDQQRSQALDSLRGRRSNNGRVGRDVLLPSGVDVVDPRFIQDDLAVLESQKMQPDKICAVYGVPKSLLGYEDIDKYATFAGRVKMYFHSTLIPMLRGIEDTFDRHFNSNMPSAYHCYVRFDYSDVPALQQDVQELFEIAGKAHRDGLPWSVLNERFDLGIDMKMVPGGMTVMVPGTHAPIESIIEEWQSGSRGESVSPAADDPAQSGKRLTNEVIKRRATDTRSMVQRHMRLLKLERELRGEWKSATYETMRAVQRELSGVTEADEVQPAVRRGMRGHTKKLLDLTAPYHQKAATEGVASIMELVEGKLSHEYLDAISKASKWSDEVSDAIGERKRFITDMSDALFDDVTAAAKDAVLTGSSRSEVTALVQARFNSARGGINRSLTIARNEVGSAYNVARNSEAKAQGFTKHSWLTAADELVRETHAANEAAGPIKIGEPFPGNGLRYPMDQSGSAEEVINCRCEAIPEVD